MPKMKTNRAAAKRFKVTGSGRIMKKRSFMNHLLEKKSTKRKRRLNRPEALHKSEVRRVKTMLPYA
ncbi:MAG TPA: 50S ribosomal protein L35 [Firmicutes bacterium]|nr:50S ribosomal protein L35 [Bacillota bacterium]